MAKDDRLFAPFPIEMDEHPKIIGLSDAAFRAVFEATFYSRRMMSDGFLDERVVLKRWGQAVADELSSNDPERPSWVRVELGWQIHNFDRYHPVRAEIEAKRAEIAQRRSAAGKRGNEKRWATSEDSVGSQTVAKGSQTDRKPLANHRSETETETETVKKEHVQATPARDFESEFAEWWVIYPRKQAKAPALKAFVKARRKHSLETLMAGVRAYALLNAGGDKTKIKLPAGWLNDERWEDEAIPTTDAAPQQPARGRGPVECHIHEGYPLPCAACERAAELPEGSPF
jgi:hypothetical protein